MKKIILSFGLCISALSAFAEPITPSTEIEWNSAVVVAAAKEVLLNYTDGSSCSYKQVYLHILYELLDYGTFSVETAVNVCKNWADRQMYGMYEECVMDDRVCEEFGMALIKHNNKGIDAIYEGKGYYNANGKIYTIDKRYYVDYDANTVYVKHTHFNDDAAEISTEKCNVSVFETKTNKRIARCTSSSDDGFGGYTYFEGISPDYNGYQFKEYCHYYMEEPDNDTACKLEITNEPGADYINFYLNYYKPCVDALVEVNFAEVGDLASNTILGTNSRNELSMIYKARNFISNPSASINSYELYDTLLADYDTYCKGLEFTRKSRDGGYDSKLYISEHVKKLKAKISQAEEFFQDTKRYKNVQVSSLEEAQRRINEDFTYYMRYVMGTIQCTGTCNKIPGTQDYVTCTLGNLKATFEFDDICNK